MAGKKEAERVEGVEERRNVRKEGGTKRQTTIKYKRTNTGSRQDPE